MLTPLQVEKSGHCKQLFQLQTLKSQYFLAIPVQDRPTPYACHLTMANKVMSQLPGVRILQKTVTKTST